MRGAPAGGLLLAGLLSAPPAAAQAPPVFGSEVESVYVDVFVVDDGRPVAGLGLHDFELRDNGVRQSLALVSAEARPLQAWLVFDASSSMLGAPLQALRGAGEAFLDGLRPRDEAGLVTFSEEIALAAEPTVDRRAVRAALARIEAAGATAVLDALYAGVTLSDAGGRGLVVLFTDGQDNSSILGAEQVRRVAERSNTLVHVVGSTPPPGPWGGREREYARVLREIAEASGGRFWPADSPERLKAAFAAIAEAMGSRYVLRYEPRGVRREGWHRLEVKVRGGKGKVEARKGYWVAGR